MFCERESENCIPFLEVHVENKDERISTRVHRKITHTDRYINYSLHHHPRIKTGVIACLRDRAENICDKKHARMEKKHLKSFPSKWIPTEPYTQEAVQTQGTATCTGGSWRRGETEEDIPSLCTMHLRTHPMSMQTDWSEGSIQISRDATRDPNKSEDSPAWSTEERCRIQGAMLRLRWSIYWRDWEKPARID